VVKYVKKTHKTKTGSQPTHYKMKNWKEKFQLKNVEQLEVNPFTLIGNDWYLFTAGSINNFNTMTASWGTLGILWGKPVVTCYIRPTRYTFGFIKNSEVFTLSFLKDNNRKILNYCGSKSGRDIDKIAETGLKPVILNNNGISFEQARLIIECRKIYRDDLKPELIIPDDIDSKIYQNKDYHRIYYGEIIGVYMNIL
jgi:flavin reductase (DIM6/NTAB) family NADH-FMN oxidoreductase RutF